MAYLTGTRISASVKMTMAGKRDAGWSATSRPNRAVKSVWALWLCSCNPSTPYSAQVRRNGSHALRIMFLMLSKMLVLVSSLTKSALVEKGEQRSPKNAPERMAPPRSSGFAPSETPMLMQITPMVAAVPKEVPVSTEIPQFKRKDTSRMTSGRSSFAAWQMM